MNKIGSKMNTQLHGTQLKNVFDMFDMFDMHSIF